MVIFRLGGVSFFMFRAKGSFLHASILCAYTPRKKNCGGLPPLTPPPKGVAPCPRGRGKLTLACTYISNESPGTEECRDAEKIKKLKF